MKVITPGHSYKLFNCDDKESWQVLSFIHKDIKGDSTDRDPTILETVEDGTSNEEVLKVMIDRIEYLQSKMPCEENEDVIGLLSGALALLNHRTERRMREGIEGTMA